MKRLGILLVLLLAVGSTVYFVSCRKDKPVYSCNEELNNYATITMESHQGISRYDLAGMGIDTQYAIMASLSLYNKARILKEKLSALIEDDFVDQIDKIHLQKLLDYASADIYENEHPEQDTFLKSWQDYALNELGWSEAKMEVYTHTWILPSEIEGRTGIKANYFDKAQTDGGGGEGLSCNCSGGYLCETILGKTCIEGGCTEVRNCGFLWNYECVGRCSI